MSKIYTVDTEARSVIFPVEAPRFDAAFAEKMQADGFTPKDEYHVTVIPSDYGAQVPDDVFETMAAYFEDDKRLAPEVIYRNRVFRINKPKIIEGEARPRESLIAPLGSVALSFAIMHARTHFQIHIPREFLHVTLATRPDTPEGRRGIGISSEPEFLALDSILYENFWRSRETQQVAN
jgi:hypothetical protein